MNQFKNESKIRFQKKKKNQQPAITKKQLRNKKQNKKHWVKYDLKKQSNKE